MLRKLSAAVIGKGAKPDPDHHASSRIQHNAQLAADLQAYSVPVDVSDCLSCEAPCPPGQEPDGQGAGMGTVVDAGGPVYGGKAYSEYVLDKYGDLGELPAGFDSDWNSELAGSAGGGRGRICIVSTGQSDWPRDHTEDTALFSHHLSNHIQSLPPTSFQNDPRPPKQTDFTKRPDLQYLILPATLPPPSAHSPAAAPALLPQPSLYSSSLISQSDDPEDQTVLVFPDWKVVHEVENSEAGAQGLWDAALASGLGRAGQPGAAQDGVGRRRSWVLPYRAIVLLCSHKRRDKRCSIAAPLLRHALLTCFEKYNITADETGASLVNLDGPALEELEGTDAEREGEVGRRIAEIESVHGGEGGEVGVFNINHLGGHRYAGVCHILFPSGAYVSYGRLTPQEIPRVVEQTILQGRIVPGVLRNAVGVTRAGGGKEGCGFLGW